MNVFARFDQVFTHIFCLRVSDKKKYWSPKMFDRERIADVDVSRKQSLIHTVIVVELACAFGWAQQSSTIATIIDTLPGGLHFTTTQIFTAKHHFMDSAKNRIPFSFGLFSTLLWMLCVWVRVCVRESPVYSNIRYYFQQWNCTKNSHLNIPFTSKGTMAITTIWSDDD